MYPLYKIVFCCFLTLQLFAQNKKPILSPYKSVSLDDLQLINTDNRKNILVSDRSGNITSFSYEGESNNSYTSGNYTPINSIDASKGFNILIFYKDLQQCVFADRSLRPISKITLPGSYTLVASSSSGDLWLLNEQQSTIEKFSPLLQQTLLEIQLGTHVKTNEKITAIKEYGHFLVVTTQKSMYFFSLTGTLKHQHNITAGSIAYLSQDYVWTINGKELEKKGLYNQEQYSYLLNLANDVKNFTIPENRNLLVINTKNGMQFFKLPSSSH